jgi:hypothetical protein
MVLNMDPGAGVDLTAKRKICDPAESRTPIVKPIASHCIRHARLFHSIAGTDSNRILFNNIDLRYIWYIPLFLIFTLFFILIQRGSPPRCCQ